MGLSCSTARNSPFYKRAVNQGPPQKIHSKTFTNLPTGFNGSYWSRQPNVTFFASFSAFSLAVRSALSRLFSSLHGQTGIFQMEGPDMIQTPNLSCLKSVVQESCSAVFPPFFSKWRSCTVLYWPERNTLRRKLNVENVGRLVLT